MIYSTCSILDIENENVVNNVCLIILRYSIKNYKSNNITFAYEKSFLLRVIYERYIFRSYSPASISSSSF